MAKGRNEQGIVSTKEQFAALVGAVYAEHLGQLEKFNPEINIDLAANAKLKQGILELSIMQSIELAAGISTQAISDSTPLITAINQKLQQIHGESLDDGLKQADLNLVKAAVTKVSGKQLTKDNQVKARSGLANFAFTAFNKATGTSQNSDIIGDILKEIQKATTHHQTKDYFTNKGVGRAPYEIITLGSKNKVIAQALSSAPATTPQSLSTANSPSTSSASSSTRSSTDVQIAGSRRGSTASIQSNASHETIFDASNETSASSSISAATPKSRRNSFSNEQTEAGFGEFLGAGQQTSDFPIDNHSERRRSKKQKTGSEYTISLQNDTIIVKRDGKQIKEYEFDPYENKGIEIRGKNTTTTIFLDDKGNVMKNIYNHNTRLDEITAFEKDETLTFNEKTEGKYTFKVQTLNVQTIDTQEPSKSINSASDSNKNQQTPNNDVRRYSFALSRENGKQSIIMKDQNGKTINSYALDSQHNGIVLQNSKSKRYIYLDNEGKLQSVTDNNLAKNSLPALPIPITEGSYSLSEPTNDTYTITLVGFSQKRSAAQSATKLSPIDKAANAQIDAFGNSSKSQSATDKPYSYRIVCDSATKEIKVYSFNTDETKNNHHESVKTYKLDPNGNQAFEIAGKHTTTTIFLDDKGKFMKNVYNNNSRAGETTELGVDEKLNFNRGDDTYTVGIHGVVKTILHKYQIIADGNNIKITRDGQDFRNFGLLPLSQGEGGCVKITGENATTTLFLEAEGKFMKNVVNKNGLETTTAFDGTLALSESIGGKYKFEHTTFKQVSKQQSKTSIPNLASANTSTTNTVSYTVDKNTVTLNGKTYALQSADGINAIEIEGEGNKTTLFLDQHGNMMKHTVDKQGQVNQTQLKDGFSETLPKGNYKVTHKEFTSVELKENSEQHIKQKVTQFTDKLVGFDKAHENKHVRSNKSFTGKILHPDDKLLEAKNELHKFVTAKLTDLIAQKDNNQTAKAIHEVIVMGSDQAIDKMITNTLQAFSQITLNDDKGKKMDRGATVKYRGLAGGAGLLETFAEGLVALVKTICTGGKDNSFNKWRTSQTELVVKDPKQLEEFMKKANTRDDHPVNSKGEKEADAKSSYDKASKAFDSTLSKLVSTNKGMSI